jgi:hypothetical protein
LNPPRRPAVKLERLRVANHVLKVNFSPRREAQMTPSRREHEKLHIMCQLEPKRIALGIRAGAETYKEM